MRRVALVLVCLACAGHGRRTQAASKRSKDRPTVVNPMQELATLLLSSDPTTAFNLAGPNMQRSPGLSSISRNVNVGHRAPVMNDLDDLEAIEAMEREMAAAAAAPVVAPPAPAPAPVPVPQPATAEWPVTPPAPAPAPQPALAEGWTTMPPAPAPAPASVPQPAMTPSGPVTWAPEDQPHLGAGPPPKEGWTSYQPVWQSPKPTPIPTLRSDGSGEYFEKPWWHTVNGTGYTRPDEWEEMNPIPVPAPLPEGPLHEHYYAMKAIREDFPAEMMEVTGWMISNEAKNYLWKMYIDDIATGGIQIGLGSEQNYVLAGWSKPDVMIMMDRDANLQWLHKAYHCAFMIAETCDEFVDLFNWEKPWQFRRLYESVMARYPGEIHGLMHVLMCWRKILGIKLDKLQAQYQELAVPMFLTDQGQFDFIKDLYRQGRVLIIGGDLYGGNTMSDIATFSRSSGLPVRLLYISNARLGPRDKNIAGKLRDNIVGLPYDDKSLVIRTTPLDGEQRDYPKSKVLGRDQMWIFYTTTREEMDKWLEKKAKRDVKSWYDR